MKSIKLTTCMDNEHLCKPCCMLQGEGYVSLHAYSTHMMPGAPPPFDMPLEDGPLTPDMPDEELPVVSTAQMSESFSQASNTLFMAHCACRSGPHCGRSMFWPGYLMVIRAPLETGPFPWMAAPVAALSNMGQSRE